MEPELTRPRPSPPGMNMTIRSKIDATSRGRPAAPMRALHASTRITGTDAPCMRAPRHWSDPAGRALVTAGMLVGGLVTLSSALAQESPTSDTPPSFFSILKAQGSLAEGVTIGGRTQERLVLESGGPDYRFIEYPSWHQVRLTFDLNKVVDTETVLATMRAAKAAMQRACGDGALELAAAEQPIGRFALGQATDGFISATYRRLYEEGLVGTFSCRAKVVQAGPPWRIQWESGNRNPTAVIPPNEWRFLIEGVSTEAFVRHWLRFGEHRRATDALRAKVGIGAKVQMMADDVPVALLAKTKQPDNARKGPYAVCGLVTGLNLPLVQVQVQLDTFMIPIQCERWSGTASFR